MTLTPQFGHEIKKIRLDRQLRQSDLGMTPFSVLGGAIRVQDRIDVRVRLLARPAAD